MRCMSVMPGLVSRAATIRQPGPRMQLSRGTYLPACGAIRAALRATTILQGRTTPSCNFRRSAYYNPITLENRGTEIRTRGDSAPGTFRLAEAQFEIEASAVTAREYCNLHGFWNA
jgi:hypothetical protein